MSAGEVVGQRVRVCQQQLGEAGDLVRLRQPALAGVRTGEPPDGRLEDHGTSPPQRRDVVDGGRVLPHLGVHGRDVEQWTPRGEQRVGQQVVGQPVRGTGEQVGGCRRDDDEFGVAAEVDVRDVLGTGPDVGRDGVVRQGGPGGGSDELQRGLGGHDLDVVAGLGEPAQQVGDLVGGNSAADAENHPACAGSCARRLARKLAHRPIVTPGARVRATE
jgi:hypothetical protein